MWNRDFGYGGGRPDMGPPRGRWEYDRGYRRHPQSSSGGYGRDYWWIGEREMQRNAGPASYDDSYRRFSRQTRPRFSPVGGMYGPVGGWTMVGNAPEPLREYRHFNEWTRWF